MKNPRLSGDIPRSSTGRRRGTARCRPSSNSRSARSGTIGYDRIAERLSRFRQVRTLRLITGTYDLQIIVTGKNMQEVSRFVSEHVAPMDRIRETATHIIMKSYKENGNTLFEQQETERLPYSF